MGLPCKIPPSIDEMLRIRQRASWASSGCEKKAIRRRPDYLNLGNCGSGRLGGGPGQGGYCGCEGPLYERGMMTVAREQFVAAIDIFGAIQSRTERTNWSIAGARTWRRCQ